MVLLQNYEEKTQKSYRKLKWKYSQWRRRATKQELEKA
jgi:hypothetical protein